MIILDASAGCALSLGWPEGEKFHSLMYCGERTLAPELYLSEVAHVLQKHVRGGKLGVREASEALSRAISLIDELVPMKDLAQEALFESLRLQHSGYDMFYFVLARRNAATLFTLDRRLVDLAMRNGLNCVFDAEVAPGETWAIRTEVEDGRDL